MNDEQQFDLTLRKLARTAGGREYFHLLREIVQVRDFARAGAPWRRLRLRDAGGRVHSIAIPIEAAP